jgi:hypothetical protein
MVGGAKLRRDGWVDWVDQDGGVVGDGVSLVAMCNEIRGSGFTVAWNLIDSRLRDRENCDLQQMQDNQLFCPRDTDYKLTQTLRLNTVRRS